MQNFVNKILAPYFSLFKQKLGLPLSHCVLWLINCWSVHHSEEFLLWMATFHLTIIIIFVPTGCTGLFQACDVGLQRLLKHSLKVSAHEDVIAEVLEQLKQGNDVTDVKIDTTLGVLCNRTVHWLWTAYNKLNKPEIITKVCDSTSDDLSADYIYS